MIDPSLELQAAIVARLKSAGAVTAIVSDRVYDRVAPTAAKPYVNMGQPQVLPDKADCIDAAENIWTVHGWSSDGGKSVEIKQLGKAVAAALDDFEFTLAGHRTVLCELEQTQYLDDPDGLTKHVAVTIRVLTEPT